MTLVYLFKGARPPPPPLKGAPASECRTSTRLVSPASGHKKKMELLNFTQN